VKAYEVLKLPEELPLTTRRADLMVRIDEGLSGMRQRRSSVVQIFDCQVQRDRRLPRSMLTRAALAHDLYELPVKTTLLALTPKAVVQARYVFGTADDGEESRHCVTVRRVFEESADAALKSELAELLPLVPVMQASDGDQARLVHTVIERIVERVLADEKRKIMLEQAANFATLRLPRAKVSDIVQRVVGSKRIMIDPLRDFPLVRDGYRKGIREGKREGIREGKSAGKAESVLMLLEARGVKLSPSLRDQILSCDDPATLDRWFRNAVSATTAAEVFASS
jgi:predicted transposase YdaD